MAYNQVNVTNFSDKGTLYFSHKNGKDLRLEPGSNMVDRELLKEFEAELDVIDEIEIVGEPYDKAQGRKARVAAKLAKVSTDPGVVQSADDELAAAAAALAEKAAQAEKIKQEAEEAKAKADAETAAAKAKADAEAAKGKQK